MSIAIPVGTVAGMLLLICQPVPLRSHFQQHGAVLPGREAPGHEMQITRKLPILFRFTRHNRQAADTVPLYSSQPSPV
jgi:hypothetical protein